MQDLLQTHSLVGHYAALMILRELFSLSHRNLNASHQAKPTCEAAHCADVTTSGTSGIYKHIQTRIDARVCICNGTKYLSELLISMSQACCIFC